ncbi:MAG: GTP-binding protein, partial [Verrucomicrobia bacterium]|nr:GTP-binding protein [Verrucomicrobiota bacterium]
ASFSFRFDRPFSVERLQDEIQEFATRAKVFRSKGILWVEGTPRRAVFHGVNNRFTIYWDRLWEKTETRFSQLVFIGKDLDRNGITQLLTRCLA